MDLQERNLSIEVQGEDVQLLHSELQSLGYDISQDEIARSFFGPATHEAVLDFQRKHGLEPNGIVDERTAHAINGAVEAQRPIPEQFVVSGQVRHQDETSLEGLIVKAFDIDPRGEIQLGEETITNGAGAYEIIYSAEALSQREKRRADLLVRVFSAEGTSLAESTVKSNAADHETVDLIVEPQFESTDEEQLETREIVFRLLNEETEEPLSGYSVRGFDLDAGEEPVELGFDITNARGLFSIVYTTSPEEPAAQRRFRLHVIDSEGEEIHQTEIVVAPDQTEIVDVSIPITEVPEPPSPELEELNESLQLELPQELLARLEEENIRTIDDIRKAGGISELENLPIDADHPAVRTVEAHANLSVLSSDTALNVALIETGFDSVATIANTTKDDFVGAMAEQIGMEKAQEVHSKASNQDLFLCNMETMLRTDQANGLKLPLDIDPSQLSATRCECADCESAVSPLAYLADLLKYVVKNLRVNKGNKKITLSDLALQFHQPFDKLPASCEEMDNTVRQVRLCIEVLRHYLKVNNLPAVGSSNEKTLLKAEQLYLIDAYESLLTQLGTSFEEIRLARNADSKTRKALALKLGIGLDTNRPDQLDQLLLNTDPLAKSEFEELNENNLEILFGLVSTDIVENLRNPLSDGPSRGDNKDPQITRWNLEGAEWERNTDADGFIYVKLTSPAAGGSEIKLYRDKAKTLLVASGQSSTSTGIVEVRPEKFSGLSGQIEIAHTNDSEKIQLSAIPKVLSWRLAYLRTVWKAKDWPATAAADSSPLVDPDLINRSDLRTELEVNPAYDLWKERSTLLSGLLVRLKNLRQAPEYATDSERFQAIFHGVTGESLTALREPKIKLEKGESVNSELKDLGLTNGAFKYLLRFLALVDRQAPQIEILDSEWDEVYNILIEAYKRNVFQQWQQDEENKKITLSPDFFKLRDTALTIYPLPKPTSLPAWRATLTDQLSWKDELESRIDQEDDLIDAFENVNEKAEETVLEDLRDALILSTGKANEDLETQAKWVTDYLLIDAKADTCQKTTRISQAIETIQNLLWSMRTGQLVKYKDLDFTSGAKKYFDQEWQWIGSYTSWRAAMLVFLYPENILIPTLRKKQTPAFSTLVKNLRKNRRLNPEQACQEAKTYSDYFRDICNLKVDASCHANTWIVEGECRDKKEKGQKKLFYMFARGGHTNVVYWSTYDTKNKTDYAQRFWQAIPKLTKVENIIGAQPYGQAIYLFVRTKDENKHKLLYVKYDLKNPGWGEPEELDPPEGVVRFSAVMNQRLDNWLPRLAIYDNDTGKISTQRFGADGTDWEEDKFQRIYHIGDPGFLRPVAMHQKYGGSIVVIYQSTSNALHLGLYEIEFKNNVFFWKEKTLITIKESLKGHWAGSFQWKNDNSLYVVWAKNKNTWYQVFQVYDYNLSILVDNQGKSVGPKKISNMSAIACQSGVLPSSSSRYIVHEKEIKGLFEILLTELTRDNQKLLKTPKPITQVAPQTSGPFDIVERLSQKDLQAKRKQIKRGFDDNKGAPGSIQAYIKEAYYYIPMLLALQLQKQGHYIAALDWYRNVYDYTIPEQSQGEKRKIYYGLTQEETLKQIFQRREDWMRDPLTPHLIASTRLNAYTRFTLLSIVRCLLASADAEFTRDTTESLARARTLYRTALELLETKELKQDKNACDKKIGELIIDVEDAVPDLLINIWTEIKLSLQEVKTSGVVENLAVEIKKIIAQNDSWENRLNQIQSQIRKAISQQPFPKNFDELQLVEINAVMRGHQRLLSVDDIAFEAREVGTYDGEKRQGAAVPSESEDIAASSKDAVYNTRPSFHFCISPNPVLKALRLKVQLNLHKLRTCRNIAGMKRAISPYSTATDQISGLPQIGANGNLVLPGTVTIQPTLYRYSVLIARAKELVNIAQQMESAMLSAIEKTDAEAYNRLKARQDMQLARSQVKLQMLRVKEAKDGVKLAEFQKERPQLQVDHYDELLNKGLSSLELFSIAFQGFAVINYHAAAAAKQALTMGFGGLGEIGAAFSAQSSLHQMLASFERRAEQWKFEKSLAEQDIKIGTQQIKISQDHVRVVGQEHTIAKLQKEQAKDTMEFLAKKFTNAELYDWMSEILEEVYAYFLQEATAVAKLAENQLAFERQSTPANYIQDDYWEAPSEDMVSTISSSGKTTDRRGLTGSARLLQDLYQLDQYAFETDKWKLQLTKTISLAALAPIEFQRFRETGKLAFNTTMDMFDRDFPGHYLRLVKRVRTSVIALIPPTQGIRATLSTTGLSRAVINGTVFQKVNVKRNPELVALSSPRDATGLFELQQQSEILLPFEGSGVDASWEFSLPKPANQFDYSTIADVLITIDYTALNDTNYRQQVLQTISPKLSADRPFSFRHEFADAWYDLHNPDQTKNPMEVTFKTRKEDFPPNLDGITIQHIVLYFSKSKGETGALEIPVTLQFRERTATGFKNAVPVQSTEIKTIDGVISTRRGHASEWLAITGSPFGKWTLKLPDNETIRDLFEKDKIEDILFVITYKGQTPAWPQ